MKTLILGGIRSGKSRLAEQLAKNSGLPVACIATATALDDEMKARIAEHQRRRPAGWQLIEEPIALGAALAAQAAPGRCLIVDCLALWLTNLLMAGDEAQFLAERQALLDALPQLPGEIILVGNETNMGVVPMGALSRRWCDEAGLLHQEAARCCERVVLTIAGLPQTLKGDPL